MVRFVSMTWADLLSPCKPRKAAAHETCDINKHSCHSNSWLTTYFWYWQGSETNQNQQVGLFANKSTKTLVTDDTKIWISKILRPSEANMRKQTVIGSDNGLSPGWHSTIIRSRIRILVMRLLATNVKFKSKSMHFHWQKIHLKTSSGKWRPFCLGHNRINIFHDWIYTTHASIHLCICALLIETKMCRSLDSHISQTWPWNGIWKSLQHYTSSKRNALGVTVNFGKYCFTYPIFSFLQYSF